MTHMNVNVYICICTPCVYLVLIEARRKPQVHWNWSYKQWLAAK